MNQLTYLALKYKHYFYAAGVDTFGGFLKTLTLMAIFLLSVVFVGFSSPGKAIFVFIVLSLFFSIFPVLFPKDQ